MFFTFLLFIFIIAILFAIETGKSSTDIDLPYIKREFLLNIPERRFFEGLQSVIPNNYVVYPQVPLAVIVDTYTNKRNFWRYQNRINRKIIDFVIFERKYLRPVIAIEYDGATHLRADRIKRDAFVESVFNKVGIKIIRVKHGRYHNFNKIKIMILNNLQ